MQIDKLTIAMRPRSSWKAFDLGLRMCLQWAGPLYGFMLVSTLPVFLLCCLLSPEYGVWILWLFKPWFERGLLFIYSRHVFGQKVSMFEAIQAWPSQIKPLWLGSVTWLRLSLSRGFDLPVAQLEGLKGQRRSKRLRVLHQTSDDNSYWWLIICLHWELFITLGLLIMINMLIPQGFDWDIFESAIDGSEQFLTIYNICWYAGIVLVAPLYVGGSFSAYLNRRIVLEGWDIELGFKKIRNRWSTKNIGLALALFVGFSSYTGFSPNVIAQTSEQEHLEAPTPDTPSIESNENELSPEALEKHNRIKQDLSELLALPPFNNKEIVKKWRWVGWKYEPEKSEKPDFSGWEAFFAFIATFAEVILWGFFIILLVLILWLSRERLARLLNFRLPDKKKKFELPSFSRGIKKSALPKDIPKELTHLLEQKSYRQALSLLLVSSLVFIHQKYDLVLTESMTEQECLFSIRQAASGKIDEFMTDLIQIWVELAWAHRWPSETKMIELCDDWKHTFFVATSEVAG